MSAKRYVITLTPEAAAKLEKWLGGPLAISPDVGYGMPDILADLRNENGTVADYNRAEADRRLEAREPVRISGLDGITDSEYERIQERLRRGVTIYHAGGPG